MARVTVEDCVLKIPNRFQLVMMAAQRSRELSVGGELTVDRDNDKNPVVALREIADETLDLDALKDSLVNGLQRVLPSEDEDDAAAAEKPKADLEALPAPPVEMDEAEMLKALQNDRDGAPDGRI